MNNLWENLLTHKTHLTVVGQGYVGLPLAHAFARHFRVIGFDTNSDKISLLKKAIDPTGEVPEGGLGEVTIDFTSDPELIKRGQFIVVAVPTPIDKHKRPDLSPLLKASEFVGKNMSPGSVVVFESTVYPGATEEDCLPILERESGLKLGRDFAIGYSPERINPGDKKHRLENIVKVVSGSDPDTLDLVAKVYGKIIQAGIHKAPSIRVAEAAKVIENTQRDLNIALMNELAIIFKKLGIDTQEVLAAAGTKWNFLNFVPGLVGGHCIGVDPYYLTFKAEEFGYHPEVILAGRRINDEMGIFIAENAVKEIINLEKPVKGAKVLILGLTFKENVPDLRNTRVIDIVRELKSFGIDSSVFDPLANSKEAESEYGLQLIPEIFEDFTPVDAIIVAVAHSCFASLPLPKLASICTRNGKPPLLLDIKGVFSEQEARQAGFHYWRL